MKKKSESKKDRLVGFIKHKIDFDITPFIILNWSKRKYLSLEIYEIPENVIRDINNLAHQYKKFIVAPNGFKIIALFYSDSL